MNVRLLAACCIVACSATSARGDDAPKTLAQLRNQVGKAYEASRASLAEKGKKARAAAAANDFEAWKAANSAYLDGAADLQLACENAVRDLATKPSDVGDRGFKAVFDTLAPFLQAAGPLLEARLRLQAYSGLVERVAPTERRAALDALGSIYFTGK